MSIITSRSSYNRQKIKRQQRFELLIKGKSLYKARKYIIEYNDICKGIRSNRYIRQATPIKAFSGKIVHDLWGREAAIRKSKLKRYNKTIFNSSHSKNNGKLGNICNIQNNSLYNITKDISNIHEYKTLRESIKL